VSCGCRKESEPIKIKACPPEGYADFEVMDVKSWKTLTEKTGFQAECEKFGAAFTKLRNVTFKIPLSKIRGE